MNILRYFVIWNYGYVLYFYKPVLFYIIRLSKNKTNQLTWPKCVPGPCAHGGIAASWKKILRAVWNYKITIIRLNFIFRYYYYYMFVLWLHNNRFSQSEFCSRLRIVSSIFRQRIISHITFNIFTTKHALPVTHYTLIVCL